RPAANGMVAPGGCDRELAHCKCLAPPAQAAPLLPVAAQAMPSSQQRGSRRNVALVLAGGGARGAYEIGALSVLLPRLTERGERPNIMLGTSVGALNAAYLAAGAAEPIAQVV